MVCLSSGLKQVVWIVGLKISVFTCSVFTGSAFTGSVFTGVSGFFCSVDGVEEFEGFEVELYQPPPPQLYPPHDELELEELELELEELELELEELGSEFHRALIV